MLNPINDLFYYPIGFLYLWIRYRNRQKVQEAKREYYDGSYAIAGAQFALSLLGILLFLIFLGFLIAVIYSAITNPEGAAVR